MARIGKTTVFFFVFLLCMSFASAIDDVDKVYFQQLLTTLTAQINAKIDANTNKVQNDMNVRFDSGKEEVKTAMTNEIKGSLKSVAIGLAGLIIITLAIFKVIDLKISSTRNLKKYENLMQLKTEELNQLILQATVERNQLENARMQLGDYQKRLQNWDRQIQGQQQQVNQVMTQYNMQPLYPQQQINSQMPQQNLQQPFRFPNPPQQISLPQKKSIWKSLIIIILIIISLILTGIIIYKFFIIG